MEKVEAELEDEEVEAERVDLEVVKLEGRWNWKKRKQRQ